MRQNYQGVILAAGRGARILPLGNSFPKALLPVCNEPIVSHQLRCMRSLGIQEVFVVCGYKKEMMKRVLGKGDAWDLCIRYVEQENLYGIGHSLSLVEPLVSGPVLVFLGDICFGSAHMETMLERFEESRASSVLAVNSEAKADKIRMNFEVLFSQDGLVKEVIEKPQHPTGRVKGCGIYLFETEIFNAIRRTPRSPLRNEYEITHSIQILINDGLPVHAVESVDWDINVTDVNDLLRANLKMLDSRGLDKLVGEGARVHPGADVQRSVIGNNVVVPHPIKIQDSLLLSGSRVPSGKDLHRVVVHGDHVSPCSKT